MYENVAAQIISSSGNKLFYHTWKKDNNHEYEVDFLTASNAKLVPIEIKTSSVNTHKSIAVFGEKYSKKVYRKNFFHKKMLVIGKIYCLSLSICFRLFWRILNRQFRN